MEINYLFAEHLFEHYGTRIKKTYTIIKSSYELTDVIFFLFFQAWIRNKLKLDLTTREEIDTFLDSCPIEDEAGIYDVKIH